jgi:hypothetical protein
VVAEARHLLPTVVALDRAAATVGAAATDTAVFAQVLDLLVAVIAFDSGVESAHLHLLQWVEQENE